MAINIKELFNADADNIRVDKINYNFDQLLANGGGPAGVKGDPGITGNTGTKGQKGEIGNKGDEGSKGEQGTSADLWDRDDLTSGSNDFTILRPYNLEGGGNSDFRTRVIIGQDTSIAIDTAPTAPTSLLTIELPTNTNNDVTSQLSFTNNETGDPREFKMSTAYEVGTGTEFTISGASAVFGEQTDFTISIPNDIELASKVIKLSAQSNIIIENTSQGNITIGNLSGDTFDINILSDNIIHLECSDIELESGNIVANASDIDITAASGTIDLSSDTTTLTAVVKNELTSDLNEITATGQNVITASSSGEANILNVNSGYGVNALKVLGNSKFATSSQINTSYQSIIFNMLNTDHDGTTGAGTTGADHGDGIEFKAGGSGSNPPTGDIILPAPNNGTPSNERTLSDYFEAGDVNLWTSDEGHIKKLDSTTANVKEWYDGTNWDSYLSTLELGVAQGQTQYSSSTWGHFSYTKIGNIIHGHGHVRVSGQGSGTQGSAGWYGADNENRMAIVIDLNNSNKFPYLNNSGSPCIVDISLGGYEGNSSGYAAMVGTGDGTETISYGGQPFNIDTFQNPKSGLNSSDVGLSAFRDIIRLKGIIPANRNEIAIVYDAMNPGFSSTGGLQNDIFTLGFAPAWVSTGIPVVFNFSFTMQTDWDSYNRIVNAGSINNPTDDSSSDDDDSDG